MAVNPGPLRPAEGRLLVASPVIDDPNFHRTVVGLLEHDDELGTLGVVLNRPTPVAIADVVDGWDELTTEPSVLFAGGPVGEGSALGLALIAEGTTSAEWTAIFDRLAIVDLDKPVAEGRAALERLRLYRGYAGWGPGQLRAELQVGAWWVFDSEPADWFAADPDELRARVLRRQGGRWRMWANAPDDATVN
jgi:putative transcriptional regulator